MFWRIPWKPTLLWASFGFFLVIFTLFHELQVARTPVALLHHEYFSYDLDSEEPFDPEQVCKLPRIHPFDPSILNYLSPPKPIKCKQRQLALTYVDQDGFLRFNDTAISQSGYVACDLLCSYQELIRPEHDDTHVTYGEARPLSCNGTKMDVDFAFVSCYNFASIPFYSNIHYSIIPREPQKYADGQQKQAYNVLLVGIDSLSRLSFIRNLPKTYHFLTTEMKSFVFRGMTKVGDNTFPNLVAILTGKSAHSDELPPVKKDESYDEWPCVWKNFSKHGYVTMFAEDRPDIALFNYFRGGFRNPPTDHYLRPYWLSLEFSALHRLSSSLCFGSVPKHILQLNYTADFVKRYVAASRPFFGFSFFVELSHDYVSRISAADDDFERWLRDLYSSGYFNETFFFFLSDHGHRFDAMRATLVGRIEERMPFFALSIPKSFRHSHKEVVKNIEENIYRLTSPFDVYFTLLDILRFSNFDIAASQTISTRGSSLFGKIASTRTCHAAGIPEHYCTCEEERTLAINDSRSVKAADVVVDHINDLLSFGNGSSYQCSRLNRSAIQQADLIVPNKKVVLNSRVYFGKLVEDGQAAGMMSKLRIVVRTTPGNALFEATLVHREDDDVMNVLGDVSRINQYGSQSWCTDDPVLKKFCVCPDKAPTETTGK